MITYPQLGQNGRLGNQLWQIASTIGIAVQLEEDWSFPDWPYREHFQMPDEWFTNKPGVDASNLAIRLPERARIYLQDSYYVQLAEDIIRPAFQLRPDPLMDNICDLAVIDQAAAVHVRRGDYAEEWRGHGMLERDWYLQNWPSKRVVVFSDDRDWCDENLPGRVARFSEMDDFYLMAHAKEHLISNSSFAWWAAWIAGGNVTYPDPWFTSAAVGNMHWPGWKKAPRVG